MSTVNIEVSGLQELCNSLEQAGTGLKKDMEDWLDAVGNEFLRLVQDEIIQRGAIDTRLMLNSFEKGGSGNIWKASDGGLSLEVGTNVEYAKYVNDGHWTTSGAESRFVPGEWQGDKFVYDPGASTGMLLHRKWVSGKPFFDSALRLMGKMFPELLETKMQEWIAKYF